MKLENQVVSLELSKKLKSLGFEQESLFWWAVRKDDGKKELGNEKTDNPYWNWYSAFNVAELGDMLPKMIKIPNSTDRYYLSCMSIHGGFTCGYVRKFVVDQLKLYSVDATYYQSFTKDTEANARAKMIIYLKENNLL
jgi:hypothetical protein